MQASAQPVTGPAVWTAADFPQPRAWTVPFTGDMIEEIEAAVRAAQRRGLGFERLTRSNFPLPRTAALLEAAVEELEEGRGFTALAGFPVARWDRDACLLAFAGVAAHIGPLVPQSYAGAMVADVADKGLGYSEKVRGYNGNRLLPFHTDGAAVAALMCLGLAAEGGENILLSAGAVHNAVLAERPDLYAVLRRGFHHHRRGEHAPDEPPISPEPIPVFGFEGGVFNCIYDRNQSVWAEKAGIRLTPEQWEALDFFDAVLARPEFHLPMRLAPGDMQFLNNFSMLHSRTEYRDGPGRRRHLLRLWLDLPGGRHQGLTMAELYRPPAAAGGLGA